MTTYINPVNWVMQGQHSSCQSLALRSSLELKLPSHRAVGIILQLEYVFSSPLGGDGNLSVSQLAATSRYPTMNHSATSPWKQPVPSQLYPSPLASPHKLSHVIRFHPRTLSHTCTDTNTHRDTQWYSHADT
ncbi:hypothetical protein J4Q44_G00214000 [Coregonus suidteri]|uniref:Uncharacterized protein n=1 Tax=Coregonus suidteri TaxID=861788 RepID=A0AAN8LER3_9TELE